MSAEDLQYITCILWWRKEQLLPHLSGDAKMVIMQIKNCFKSAYTCTPIHTCDKQSFTCSCLITEHDHQTRDREDINSIFYLLGTICVSD